MSNLALQSQSNNYPATQAKTSELAVVRKAVTAGVRVFDVENDDIILTAVNRAVTIAYRDAGFKPQGEELNNIMCNDITDYIIEKMPSLRIEEIEIAIANGVLGEYGEYMGLYKPAFVKFLKGYYMSEQRSRAMLELMQVEKAKAIPTFEAQFNTGKANVIEMFKRLDSKENARRFGSACYDFLNQLALLNYTTAQKKEFLSKALQILLREAEAELSTFTLDMFNRLPVQKFVENLINAGSGSEELTGKDRQKQITLAKYLTVSQYHADLQLSGADIAALVESRRGHYEKVKKQQAQEREESINNNK